jgi:cobalt-zinc-cadmium efflux system protein
MMSHANNGNRRRLAWSMLITLLVLVAEVLGGLWTGSLALLSDAAHVFIDIFALGLSYLALRVAELPPDDRHTYGYHRMEVLAALANGVILVLISAGIIYEAYRRYLVPEQVKSGEMLIIATIGLAANLVVAQILRPGERGHTDHVRLRRDVNMSSAFLHVVGDAISSVGVIVAAVAISLTGKMWIDPLVSALIGVIILVSAVRVLHDSLHILVEGTPEGLDLAGINTALEETPGVTDVHDLHVWSICSGQVALSAHIVLTESANEDQVGMMSELKKRLDDDFGIEHTTIQFECAACGQGRSLNGSGQRLAPSHSPHSD